MTKSTNEGSYPTMNSSRRKVLTATAKYVAHVLLLIVVVAIFMALFLALPVTLGIWVGDGAGTAMGFVQLIIGLGYLAARLDEKNGRL